MKNLKFKISQVLFALAFVTTISIFTACTNDGETIEPSVLTYQVGSIENGWAAGISLGEHWEASAYAREVVSSPENVNLLMYNFNSYGALRQQILIKKLPLAIGTFEFITTEGVSPNQETMEVDCVAKFMGGEGDIELGGYRVDTKDVGFVTISEIDLENKWIKGSFEVFLELNSGGVPAPKELDVQSGTFEVKIVD